MTLDYLRGDWVFIVGFALVIGLAILLLALLMRPKETIASRAQRGALWPTTQMDSRTAVDFRDLQEGARADYLMQWRAIRSRFARDPQSSLVQADGLARAVLASTNIPQENLSEVIAALPPEPAAAVRDYRRAHAVRMDIDEGRTMHQDLVRAILAYGAMFGRLLHSDDAAESLRSIG